MSVFNNLLHLYKTNGASNQPTEDFCTECLAGILRSDHKLFKEFVNQILQLPADEPYKIYTQRTYYTEEGDQGIVDMVFESESYFCFLEMKVESGEGTGQLKKYGQILSELSTTKQDTYLRYCSLYIDNKKGNKNFNQFRWVDIADFLKPKIYENKLINEFYNFLKEKKMAGNERFNHEDLMGLKVYGDIAEKVKEVFSLVEKKLETFGRVQGGLNASSQITNHNRWATFCNGVIGKKGSEILVSFDFKGIRYPDEPVLAVQLFVNRKNTSYTEFTEVSATNYQDKKFEGKDIHAVREHGVHIRFEKPIALFFSEEPQLQIMSQWVEERLIEIRHFIEEHPNLPWRVKFIK